MAKKSNSDSWCKRIAFVERCSALFNLAVRKSAFVVEVGELNQSKTSCNVGFIPDFNDWEIEEINDLLSFDNGTGWFDNMEPWMFRDGKVTLILSL